MANIESAQARAPAPKLSLANRLVRYVAIVLLAVGAFLAGTRWQAWKADGGAATQQVEEGAKASDAEHGHGHSHEHANDGHDHSHEDDLSLVELSKQARGNIGLKVGEIAFSSFTRSITVPAIVAERPGQTQFAAVAPLSGVVTKIYIVPGQTVDPGQPLFDMRLTHEELVQGQSDFLSTLEQVDVVNKEIARLEAIARDGAIPGKVVLERQYERQKLEAIERAQEQSLLLHGLSADQVANIRADRKLLGTLTVKAPTPAAPTDGSTPHLLQVEELNAELGQNVTAGDPLCKLADHSQLYVEGKAFQQDADLLNRAAKEGAAVCALVDTGDSKPEEVCNLRILYLSNTVDVASRLFPFYALLPNELVRDDRAPDGRRYMGWRFRPGERLQLKVPVETWKERIVLPAEAVVEDGPESYVFREDGDHFHRCPVHVEYRDQFNVVLGEGNDIWPGDRVAMNSAQQLQVALKNKSGGGIDPHAGHNH
ncbi:MAG: efflux RND transporter periplasmic adaptor subunit [Pirellulales bacterium]|nr:efflux RND transporter periplasmic adaptor subunit [Pirellulales bacterium]